MAGRRRPVHCQGWHDGAPCAGVATWRKDWTQGAGFTEPEPGYLCDTCGWAVGAKALQELDVEPVDDGRIRSPEDVAPRVEGAKARAAADRRLSDLDRAVHGVYCAVAVENTSVEVMAADTWVADELGLGERGRTSVRRSRARLEALNYVRRLRGMKDVTRHGLRAAVATRAAGGLRPATLLEVRKAPPVPECEICSAEIPDGLRVWRRYCSDRCRQAAHRARAAVLS